MRSKPDAYLSRLAGRLMRLTTAEDYGGSFLPRLSSRPSLQPMQEMGDIIVQAGQLMMDAVSLLSSLGRHSARLNSLTEEMIRLEEQADQLHDQGRRQR